MRNPGSFAVGSVEAGTIDNRWSGGCDWHYESRYEAATERSLGDRGNVLRVWVQQVRGKSHYVDQTWESVGGVRSLEIEARDLQWHLANKCFREEFRNLDV